jgi:hypothetical protein
MAWTLTAASGTTIPCASTVQITSNWDAIEDWWGVEHYDFTSALSGDHKPGIAGIVMTGTYAAITGTSSPGTGALAWDNTCGVLRIYKSDNAWDRLTEDHYSRMHLKRAATQSLPATAWTAITFDTTTYDCLNEYDENTNTIAMSSDGYYLVQATATFPAAGAYEKAVGIYYEGTRHCDSGGYGTYLISCEAVDLLSAVSADEIAVYCYNGNTAAVAVQSVEVTLTRIS